MPAENQCLLARAWDALGISARVLNIHTLKPLDVTALVAAASETRGLITVEDHSIIGGLGGAVAETLSECFPTHIRRIGIGDTFCDQVGDHQELLDAYGVTPRHIAAVAQELIEFQNERIDTHVHVSPYIQ